METRLYCFYVEYFLTSALTHLLNNQLKKFYGLILTYQLFLCCV